MPTWNSLARSGSGATSGTGELLHVSRGASRLYDRRRLVRESSLSPEFAPERAH
jgi:hypothetical protein